MRKVAGNILIILSIVCIAATITWVISGLLNLPDNPTEDERTTLIALWLFAGVPGVLFILEIIVFLCGFYLRKPITEVISKQKLSKAHLLTLIIYIVTCIGLGIISGFGNKMLPEIKYFGILTCQPQVLTQLLIALIPGIKLGTGLNRDLIMFIATLLYFLIFLYPLYRIVTMDRKSEITAYKRMILFFICFASVHILMSLVIVFLHRA